MFKVKFCVGLVFFNLPTLLDAFTIAPSLPSQVTVGQVERFTWTLGEDDPTVFDLHLSTLNAPDGSLGLSLTQIISDSKRTTGVATANFEDAAFVQIVGWDLSGGARNRLFFRDSSVVITVLERGAIISPSSSFTSVPTIVNTVTTTTTSIQTATINNPRSSPPSPTPSSTSSSQGASPTHSSTSSSQGASHTPSSTSSLQGATETPHPSDRKKTSGAIIAGTTVGAITAIIILIFAIIYCFKRRSRGRRLAPAHEKIDNEAEAAITSYPTTAGNISVPEEPRHERNQVEQIIVKSFSANEQRSEHLQQELNNLMSQMAHMETLPGYRSSQNQPNMESLQLQVSEILQIIKRMESDHGPPEYALSRHGLELI